MGRKVTEDDVARWKELRKKGYTYERIGSEVGWASETIRKHIGGKKKLKENEKKGKVEPETDLELEAKAFSELEEGKNPTDLVVEGICSADMAERLTEKYTKLKNLSRPELEILEARMENASHMVRCALGKAEVEINCPICHKWGKMVLVEINGVDRWVCSSCGEIPF